MAKGSIYFHLEHPKYNFIHHEEISNWIRIVCDSENVRIKLLDFILCTDEDLLEINKKHLNHNYLTDVITFPYSEGDDLEADIFISLDRVDENSKLLNTQYSDELCRVMIHGVLHLCGYKDKTDREQVEMRKKEDYYLSLRSF
jgi:rRNA maturation RNase YbeY